MKQLFILLISATLFVSCNDKKTERDRTERRERDDYNTDDKKDKDNDSESEVEWSSSDVASFNRQCRREFPEGNEELGEKLCPCLLKKMQAKYSSLDEMDKKSTESEGKTAAEDCVESLGLKKKNSEERSSNWTSSDADEFVNSCVSNAVSTGNTTESRAQRYCSCMQQNIEEVFPDKNDFIALGSKAMENPEVKKLARLCLAGN